ncbi:MAG: hypothetical protein RMI34_00430 [Chloroherpetonaceae bacterium]|nr:hypothetical protein [Chloroherpetonaceae bacterium]
MATITGNVISFGYSGLPAGDTPNPVSGASGSPAHIAPSNVSVEDPLSDETPILASISGNATAQYNAVRGNISSTLPGDFGIGRGTLSAEYSLVRRFRTVIGPLTPPIQILSRPTTGVPTDTVIRVRFSRAISIPASDTLRNDGHTGGTIRLFRAGPGVPSGTL